MRNLFNVLTPKKYGPNTHTLATLFKEIVHTKMNYVIIDYGVTSSTNFAKIDIASHEIVLNPLRWSRPGKDKKKNEMACIWPSYQAGKHQSQQHDPPRSMSNITPALSEIAALDYHLFTANPDYSEQRKILPPWSTPSHSIFFFAMSKSEATKNKKKPMHCLIALPNSSNRQHS